MGVNKVIYDGKTLIDLTGDTVTPNTLLKDVKAHDKAGNQIVGTLTINNLLDVIEMFEKFKPTSITYGTNKVTAIDNSGNSLVYTYGGNEVYTFANGTTITRTITFNSDGSITDKYTSSNGTSMTRKTVFNSNGSVSISYS